MAIRNVSVQCLSTEEQSAAEQVLRRHGPVSRSGLYVFGAADEADVREMEGRGMAVEEVPALPDLSWLDPGHQDVEGAAELLAAGEEEPAGGSPLQEAGAGMDQVYMIQLKGPLRDEWKAELDALGVELGPYVPEYAYKTPLSEATRARVEDLGFVVRVVLYSAVHTLRRLNALRKLQGAVEPVIEVFGMAPPPPVENTYELRCHRPDDIRAVAEALRQDPRASEVVEGLRRVRFDCEEGSPLIAELARMPQVSSVDLFQFPELANTFARQAIGIDPPAGLPPLPWDGTGMLVGVADGGVDAGHPDLAGRIEKVIHRVDPGRENDPVGHGTHVCGTLAGDGTASGRKVLGMAPGAKLIVQTVANSRGKLTGLPINLGELFQEAYDLGARIHNNSWGTLAGGLYTLDSYEVDEFVYQHPDCLVIVAAGNRGVQPEEEERDDLGRIGLGSLQSPAAAKNVLTVGACCSPRDDGPFQGQTWSEFPDGPRSPRVAEEPICGDPDFAAAFSSRGPTDDNRIKPELMAPGTAVLSARSAGSFPHQPFDGFGGRYAFLSGTSMAAPVVAGAAAIVRQYYVQEQGHPPSAALLKATLVNGAVWMAAETVLDSAVGRPNHHQGFGRLDLRRTLPVPGDPSGLKLVFADVDRGSDEALKREIDTRASWKRNLEVEAGLPLRITLAWTDRPDHGLQQSLDLVLVLPDGSRRAGNPGLTRVPGQKSDHFNNLQQIVIDAPAAGSYRLQVLAYNTLYEAQGFSLVVTGKLASDLLP